MLGDWSIDPPYSFTVFGFEIYFYGAIIALGFILAALFCAKQAAKFGLTSDDLFRLRNMADPDLHNRRKAVLRSVQA